MIAPAVSRAVFLDRDGVLNRNVFYSDTSAYESPRSPSELVLADGIGSALGQLASAGFRLILVSNQPNAAKGKCTPEALTLVHARLAELLTGQGIKLDAAFYCYHHPLHTGPCGCRKPEPGLLLKAAGSFQLDLQSSWMIGDRASDVLCGRAAGCRTVWIDTAEGQQPPLAGAADLVACSLPEAVSLILLGTP
jgi:D-glycero-D-manno-heptose 1,7-bisphosphate phosphatase